MVWSCTGHISQAVLLSGWAMEVTKCILLPEYCGLLRLNNLNYQAMGKPSNWEVSKGLASFRLEEWGVTLKNYRCIAAMLYLSIVVTGLLLNLLKFWVLVPFVVTMIAGHFFAYKSGDAEKCYFNHLRTTSAISISFFVANFLLLYLAIYIDFQLGLFLPEHQIIVENPGLFMQLSNNLKYLFGLLCIGILGFIGLRSYQCLLAIIKQKPLWNKQRALMHSFNFRNFKTMTTS